MSDKGDQCGGLNPNPGEVWVLTLTNGGVGAFTAKLHQGEVRFFFNGSEREVAKWPFPGRMIASGSKVSQ